VREATDGSLSAKTKGPDTHREAGPELPKEAEYICEGAAFDLMGEAADGIFGGFGELFNNTVHEEASDGVLAEAPEKAPRYLLDRADPIDTRPRAP
jgi:hypothetical protein